MAVLCGMPTMQYSARNARLSAHKLDVYFLHTTRPSVTWLNSRRWLAACDWVMSALSAVFFTRRRRKFGEVSCTEWIGQGNEFELIPTVKRKLEIPQRVISVANFWRSVIIVELWPPEITRRQNSWEIFCVYRKTTHCGSMCCVQISLNLTNGKSVIVRCLSNKNQTQIRLHNNSCYRPIRYVSLQQAHVNDISCYGSA